MLAQIVYSRMEVELESDSKIIRIWATQDQEVIRLFSSETAEPLQIPIFIKDPYATTSRNDILAYYREEETRNAKHPVIALVKSLPTPMLLNIERRFESSPDLRPIRASLHRRREQNIFSSSLSVSLAQAAALAEDKFRKIQSSQIRLRDWLRKRFLLTTIQYNPQEARASVPRLIPTELLSRKEKITSILASLGLEEAEISEQLNPFFEQLLSIAQTLPEGFDSSEFLTLSNAISKENRNDAEFGKLSAFFQWSALSPQFYRMEMISEHVDEYLKKSARLGTQIDKYLLTVNQFLKDSGKELEFSNTGDLQVRFASGQVKPVTAVSSGETQIIVILTHLTFNPDANHANVFIVDEPELSLHVRWQELFVEAVRSAAPALQIILATHSPSIILDDLEHCVDLTPKR
jgi:hypothetical protein